jgi:hypothetical protein
MVMSGPEAVETVDKAISQCARYVQEHADGTTRSGWGWCHEAAKVALVLADVRAAVAKSVVETTPRFHRDPAMAVDVGLSEP